MLRTPRWKAVLLASALVFASVPLLGAGSAVHAAADCLTEVAPSIFDPGCDDVNPPDTGLIRLSPAAYDGCDPAVTSSSPAVPCYVDSSTVTFGLAGAYTDADADPMGFQCQFWDTATAPDPVTGTWGDCSTGAAGSTAGTQDPTRTQIWRASVTRAGLADSSATDYHLRVRAVDTADQAIAWTNKSLVSPQTEQVQDYDLTYSEIDFRVDTVAPNTFLGGQPVDDIRPDWPMVDTQNPQLQISSNEGGTTFVCAVNKVAVPCSSGIVTLRKLSAGSKTFTAYAVDDAGNRDATPVSTTFSVPKNLTAPSGSGWRTYRSGGYFAGDYLESRTVGSQVTSRATNVRELRLIAPAGPTLGKVEVKIGRSHWFTVNLYSTSPQKFHVYEVRDRYQPLTAGKITVRVKSLSAARPLVRVDAILARD